MSDNFRLLKLVGIAAGGFKGPEGTARLHQFKQDPSQFRGVLARSNHPYVSRNADFVTGMLDVVVRSLSQEPEDRQAQILSDFSREMERRLSPANPLRRSVLEVLYSCLPPGLNPDLCGIMDLFFSAQ